MDPKQSEIDWLRSENERGQAEYAALNLKCNVITSEKAALRRKVLILREALAGVRLAVNDALGDD